MSKVVIVLALITVSLTLVDTGVRTTSFVSLLSFETVQTLPGHSVLRIEP